jgi:mono/diheme cytochrome c family protein
MGQTDASGLNPTAVARGAGNWDRLRCATCHGAAGGGGAGEIDGTPAPSLQNLALTEDEFIDWMRSGGTLGSKHQYSTDRLSDSGGKNLYQFLISLRAGQ